MERQVRRTAFWTERRTHATIAAREKYIDDEDRAALRAGPPSAASTLLGVTLTGLQSECSNVLALKYQYLIEAARRAAEQQN